MNTMTVDVFIQMSSRADHLIPTPQIPPAGLSTTERVCLADVLWATTTTTTTTTAHCHLDTGIHQSAFNLLITHVRLSVGRPGCVPLPQVLYIAVTVQWP